MLADSDAVWPFAAFDGAFVAHRSHPRVTIAELLEHLSAARWPYAESSAWPAAHDEVNHPR